MRSHDLSEESCGRMPIIPPPLGRIGLSAFIEKRRAIVRVCLPARIRSMAGSPCCPRRPCPMAVRKRCSSSSTRPAGRSVRELPEFDTVLLLTRLNIDWVLAGNAVDPELVRPANYVITREESVHVTFNDGRSIDGINPDGAVRRHESRVGASSTRRTISSRSARVSRTVIVNKARVRDTRVHAISPRPEPVLQRRARAQHCRRCRTCAPAASRPIRAAVARPSPQLRARAGDR